MSMREETKRRLERAIWRERGKWAAIALGIAAIMAGVFMFISRDHTVENVRIPATVTSVRPFAAKSTQPGLTVDVTLADGKLVELTVNQITDPKVGSKVEITEHRHATGRRTYSWK
jgi:3-isopropylmalate dehydratase small subunit